MVSLHALLQVPGAAAAPCVLKVLGFHALLCFDLAGPSRINGAGLASLQEYVDAGLHSSYEAAEREHGKCALLCGDARYTACAPTLQGAGLRVQMKRGADCAHAVTLVKRFVKDQPRACVAKLSREEHRRPGWLALDMDADEAARIWNVQDGDIVAQFLARKQLEYGAVVRVGQGLIANRGWDPALQCAVFYVYNAHAQVVQGCGVFANPNPGLFDLKVHGGHETERAL